MQYSPPLKNLNRESFRVAQNQFLKHVRYTARKARSNLYLIPTGAKWYPTTLKLIIDH